MTSSRATQIGYCTNVHAGPTLATTRANLEKYALAVKKTVAPASTMGVGLWLAAPAADDLTSSQAAEFSAWLAENGLIPFTFNGFPHGNFHEAVVKHRVYVPTWWEPERLRYTLRLIEIQHTLLPEGLEGSISTLPIGWPTQDATTDNLRLAARHLAAAAETMARLHRETGRLIRLAIEPEPGCILQRTDDVCRFFHDYLLRAGDEMAIRRHIGVCHDVCHAAVMFEPQADVLKRFQSEGITIPKVQVSSAVAMPLDEMEPSERINAVEQLAQFKEERYLHQTMHQAADGKQTFYEDLGPALDDLKKMHDPSGHWRTHFHVPIYLDRFGALKATQAEIQECLATIGHTSDCQHFEVETYAWGVLPSALQVPDLATGIAREMTWLTAQLGR
jgi:sugar phosphate isomerase/epimerase